MKSELYCCNYCKKLVINSCYNCENKEKKSDRKQKTLMIKEPLILYYNNKEQENVLEYIRNIKEDEL